MLVAARNANFGRNWDDVPILAGPMGA